jgi:hypothetical protein
MPRRGESEGRVESTRQWVAAQPESMPAATAPSFDEQSAAAFLPTTGALAAREEEIHRLVAENCRLADLLELTREQKGRLLQRATEASGVQRQTEDENERLREDVELLAREGGEAVSVGGREGGAMGQNTKQLVLPCVMHAWSAPLVRHRLVVLLLAVFTSRVVGSHAYALLRSWLIRCLLTLPPR